MTADRISNEQLTYTVWTVWIQEKPRPRSIRRQMGRNSTIFFRRLCNLNFLQTLCFWNLLFNMFRSQLNTDNCSCRKQSCYFFPCSNKMSDNRNLKLRVGSQFEGPVDYDKTSLKTETWGSCSHCIHSYEAELNPSDQFTFSFLSRPGTQSMQHSANI